MVDIQVGEKISLEISCSCGIPNRGDFTVTEFEVMGIDFGTVRVLKKIKFEEGSEIYPVEFNIPMDDLVYSKVNGIHAPVSCLRKDLGLHKTV